MGTGSGPAPIRMVGDSSRSKPTMSKNSIRPENPKSGTGLLNLRAPRPDGGDHRHDPDDRARRSRAVWRVAGSIVGVTVAVVGLLLCIGYFAGLLMGGMEPTSPAPGYWESARQLLVGIGGFVAGMVILLACRPGRPGRPGRDSTRTS